MTEPTPTDAPRCPTCHWPADEGHSEYCPVVTPRPDLDKELYDLKRTVEEVAADLEAERRAALTDDNIDDEMKARVALLDAAAARAKHALRVEGAHRAAERQPAASAAAAGDAPLRAEGPRCPFCLFPPEEGHGDDCPGMWDTLAERADHLAALIDRNLRHLRLAVKLDAGWAAAE